jgi:hypothetical protein
MFDSLSDIGSNCSSISVFTQEDAFGNFYPMRAPGVKLTCE